MNLLLRNFASTVVIVGAAACGASTSAPTHDASVRFRVDGQPIVFDDGGGVSAASVGHDVRLTIGGTFGHEDGVADDGAALHLQIDLDPTALAAGALSVEGETSFAYAGSEYRLSDADIAFAPSPTSAPAAHRAWVAQECFCSRYAAESQKVTGVIFVSAVSATHLAGTVHFAIEGQVPFRSVSRPTPDIRATVDAELDVTLPPP